MILRDLLSIIEECAPKGIAWEKDNVGLQCGDPTSTVKNVLVALDPTTEVVAEAVRTNSNVVVTHHPLLFKPERTIDRTSPTGAMLYSLISKSISLISVHTNLDFVDGGTSHALATTLGLEQCSFLAPSEARLRKLVLFVPRDSAAAVADALSAHGAGRIGLYERCSFRTEGIGTFQGGPGTNPRVGTSGAFERVPEVRLEMMIPEWNVEPAIKAARAIHPYEEMAYDAYALENPVGGAGTGVIGSLRRPKSLASFLKTVKQQLGVPMLRSSGADRRRMIQRVAVCGGSGSDLLKEAIRKGADAFVTADVRYHTFHEARSKIVLIDAGHFETEQPVITVLVNDLRSGALARGEHLTVRPARTVTNPIVYS